MTIITFNCQPEFPAACQFWIFWTSGQTLVPSGVARCRFLNDQLATKVSNAHALRPRTVQSRPRDIWSWTKRNKTQHSKFDTEIDTFEL